MRVIFIQVKCELGRAYDVADAICDIESVSEVYSTSGQYDLMVKCYLQKDHDVGHFVNEAIQKVDGVRDTFTIIAFKAFG